MVRQHTEVSMSNIVPFDTLAYAKKLEARGVNNKQAEAHAEVLAEVLEASLSSKQDSNIAIANLSHEINNLKNEMNMKFSEVNEKFAEVNVKFAEVHNEMNVRFAEVHSEMNVRFAEVNGKFAEVNGKFAEVNGKIAEVKSEIIKWVFGISFAQAALIISVLKFFH